MKILAALAIGLRGRVPLSPRHWVRRAWREGSSGMGLMVRAELAHVLPADSGQRVILSAMDSASLTWVDVLPMPALNGDVASILESVRSLQRAWKKVISANDAAFQEARRRSLRRHAIETGIIERLYDIDWGVTEALVAEGLTADAVARAGDGAVSDDVLSLVRSQYEALEYLTEAARMEREISVGLVKELHVILTQNQPTYTAIGPTGMVFEATLHHGEWKRQANHVRRPDGSLLEYTPPEQVASQMERLVALHQHYADADPIIRAAWLHHRFVRIHPFEDGNGRVARCLTLLGLLKHDLAPLVVDRRERDRYLRCLDKANEGDLRPLARFFAELEIVALRSELERPIATGERVPVGDGALATLEASVARLRSLRGAPDAQEVRKKVESLALAIQANIESWLRAIAARFETIYRADVDPQARAYVQSAAPPQPEALYWRSQVIRAARSVDFYVNLHNGVWWTRLQVAVLGQRLRYLVFVQKVGRGETGVLTLTIYSETLGVKSDEEAQLESEPIVISAPTETVTWTYIDSASANWSGVQEVLDATLAATIAKFTASLG